MVDLNENSAKHVHAIFGISNAPPIPMESCFRLSTPTSDQSTIVCPLGAGSCCCSRLRKWSRHPSVRRHIMKRSLPELAWWVNPASSQSEHSSENSTYLNNSEPDIVFIRGVAYRTGSCRIFGGRRGYLRRLRGRSSRPLGLFVSYVSNRRSKGATVHREHRSTNPDCETIGSRAPGLGGSIPPEHSSPDRLLLL